MPDITVVTEGELRWYGIDGRWYISTTSFLSVLNKPGLMWWAAAEERRLVGDTLLDVLTRERAHEPEYVLDQFLKMLDSQKAHVRAKKKAGDIGTEAHAWVEWRTRRMLGQAVGPEPRLERDGAAWAVEHWKDWAKAVEFRPLAVEETVWCEDCGFAGTLDWYGYVEDVMTLGDLKTGKAIYPEAILQNVAYKHGARRNGRTVERGLILRLPKTAEDPHFEAVPVPEDVTTEDVGHVLRTWQLMRRITGKAIDKPKKATA